MNHQNITDLYKFQPLECNECARGDVDGEAPRQERAEDGGEDAEADENDEEVVVASSSVQPCLGCGVVGEEQEL